ncbi:amino acid transporter aATP11 [Angomonas deanei]|uniref:Transmembrane amino acid transporter protein, putative n=2 Tax=Angomonas deanei TaxID=59799 RepID=A0A7G2C2I7_9TRYP|nr:amino acid transporter aATP11 [Angomonas deanei]CAD2214008.1 Transmembrane amino acid transporter protein, putative [Angomonas deanei]|eukprot:EPY32305.1 amino acid transporter aATP11 [Angomonas deanei]
MSQEPREHIPDGLEVVQTNGEEENKEDIYGDRLRVDLGDVDKGKRADAMGTTEPIDTTDVVQSKRRTPRALVPFRIAFQTVLPHGGALATGFNLASTSLGAGIISLPSSFNLSGIVMATVYLVLIATATTYALYLVAKVVEITGYRNYSQATRHILGRGTDIVIAILMLILCFGGSISYIIAMSTLLKPILGHPGSPAYLKTKSGNQLITSMIWLALMFPLVMPKQINALRYVSGLGVLFIVYFVICIVVHSVQNGFHNPEIRSQLVTMRYGNSALEGLGSLLFSYMSQINGFELAYEMQPRSVTRYTVSSAISMAVVGVLYFLAGFFGYADWGDRVKDSVLVLYDPVNEPYILVGYIGIIIKICAAFSLHFHALRDAGYHLLRLHVDTVPYWQHCLLMLVPATLALICGLFIPTLNTVLGLLGSLCGGTIGMIIPPLLIMYCGNFSLRKVGIVNYAATYLLLIGGVVAVVFGTSTTIYSTVGQSFV